ncbi:hypothetical protein TNCV_4339311 [Trichonephila clavipes]|nr:hypothetical protein TNCV_4339311 [Trichonephila clavipes]
MDENEEKSGVAGLSWHNFIKTVFFRIYFENKYATYIFRILNQFKMAHKENPQISLQNDFDEAICNKLSEIRVCEKSVQEPSLKIPLQYAKSSNSLSEGGHSRMSRWSSGQFNAHPVSRWRTVGGLEEGQSQATCCMNFGVSRNGVSTLSKQFIQTGTVVCRPGQDRKRQQCRHKTVI